MSEADTLKMAAEVVDKASGPLRELQKLLRGIHEENVKQSKSQREGSEQLKQSFTGFTRSLREGGRPALAAVGLTTLSLGGAIAGIGTAIRGFSSNAYTLSLL